MLQQMVKPVSSITDTGSHSYYEVVPASEGTSSSNVYTVECGFKAKRIVCATRSVVSSVLGSGMAYDAYTNETQYINIANTAITTADIGTDPNSGRGIILKELNDTNFKIYGAHVSSPIYVLATKD